MSKHRIMIVEDEAIAGQTMFEKLTDQGYEPHGPMRTGEQAIAKAMQLRPDLILMDIQLAGSMDGIDAAAQIREQLDIPVVYLTAFSDQSVLERAKLTTPHSYLIKPVRDRELLVTLELTLERSRLEKEIKQHALELQKAREEWERTFDSVLDLIAIIGPDRHIMRCNAALAERADQEKNALEGKAILDILFDDPESNENAATVRSVIDGNVKRGEIKLTNPDGIFSMTVSPLIDAEGTPDGSVCSFHDITERIEAEEKMKRLQEQKEAFGKAMVSREHRLISMIEEMKEEAKKMQKVIETEIGPEKKDNGKAFTPGFYTLSDINGR
jgi:PAS domain S-box-containing protein